DVTAVLVDYELEVLFFNYTGVTTVVINIAGEKYRAHIGGAERLELLQDIIKGLLNVRYLYFCIYFNLRDEQLGGDTLRYYLFELVGEGLYPLGEHGHAGGVEVTSVVFQQVTALVDGLVDVEAAD